MGVVGDVDFDDDNSWLWAGIGAKIAVVLALC